MEKDGHTADLNDLVTRFLPLNHSDILVVSSKADKSTIVYSDEVPTLDELRCVLYYYEVMIWLEEDCQNNLKFKDTIAISSISPEEYVGDAQGHVEFIQSLKYFAVSEVDGNRVSAISFQAIDLPFMPFVYKRIEPKFFSDGKTNCSSGN